MGKCGEVGKCGELGNDSESAKNGRGDEPARCGGDGIEAEDGKARDHKEEPKLRGDVKHEKKKAPVRGGSGDGRSDANSNGKGGRTAARRLNQKRHATAERCDEERPHKNKHSNARSAEEDAREVHAKTLVENRRGQEGAAARRDYDEVDGHQRWNVY